MDPKIVMLVATMVLSATAAVGSARASDEPSNEQCQNYGMFYQMSVTGDNTYECHAQHCVQGNNVPVAAGIGVGTGAGKGEPTATATTGTQCTQGSGNSTNDSYDLLAVV